MLLGADYFERDHKRLLDTYREIRLLEEAVDDGVHVAHAQMVTRELLKNPIWALELLKSWIFFI